MLDIETASEIARAFGLSLADYHKHLTSDQAKARMKVWDQQSPGSDTLESLRRALLPGLMALEERFIQIPRQWPRIFRRARSVVNIERFVELRYVGLPQLRPDGARTVRDNAFGERFVYNLPRTDIALEVGLGAELCDEIEWGNIAGLAMGLTASFKQAEEILHANVLATGNVYNPMIGGDACPFFSGQHPCDTAEYSNVMEEPLTQLSLEKASILMGEMKDQAGNKLVAHPRILVVPIELQFTAARLIRGIQEDVGDDKRDLYPREYMVLDYLSDPEAWFVTTNVAGLSSIEWAPFRLDLKVEKDALVLEGTQSYTAGYYNPRACVGSFPGKSRVPAYAPPRVSVRRHAATEGGFE